jgi:anti-sigma regulatory factor (Ser/Thr protein kinase)
VRSDRLEAELSDSGEEYPGGTWGTSMPADPLQEDGRGLALATAVLDSLEYQRSAAANHWTMRRSRA